MLIDTALDLINISSSSEEGFTVERFSLSELEDRFRVAPSSITNMPTASMGSAEASIFVTNSVDARSTGYIGTRGTSIETELMDLLSDIPDISPTTFIDTSDEEMNPFPEANFANVKKNAYGRPTQRVCPMPRQQQDTQPSIVNLPNIPSQTSAFTANTAPQQLTRILVPHSKHSIYRCPSRFTLMRGTMWDMGHWVIICNHNHQATFPPLTEPCCRGTLQSCPRSQVIVQVVLKPLTKLQWRH